MPALVRIYNATLEKAEIQFCGRVYTFEPRDYAELPEMNREFEDIPAYFEENYGHKGLFAYRPGQDFKALERQALLRYLQTLNERIQNHQMKIDEVKAAGITPRDYPELRKAKLWRQEIIAKLEMEAPLEVIPSFFDDETRKSLGIEEKNAVKAEKAESLERPEPVPVFKQGKKDRKQPKDLTFTADFEPEIGMVEA